MNHVFAFLENFTWHAATRELSAEASTLGFKPGQWPDMIIVFDHALGGERVFEKTKLNRHDNIVEYTHPVGVKLVIFND